MKASELRIGNKIKFIDDGTIFTVVSIDLKGAGLENTSEFAWIEFESLEPIPFTEELFYRFGGIKKSSNRYYLGNLMFSISTMGIFKFHYSGKVAYIDYVHNFQNLIHALTGEELTIK